MKRKLSGGTWTGLTVMLLGAALAAAQVSSAAHAAPTGPAAAPPPTLPGPTIPGATTTTLLPPTKGPTASPSTPPASPGGASASAAVLGVAPQVSNLTLAVTFGQSLAAYLQTEAQASASTVNLGGLGALLSNTPVCGATAIKPDELPMPLTTDSSAGPTSQKSTGATFGEENVSVSRSPENASATTKVADVSVPGVLTVTATTTSSVHYVADQFQEADASVTETVDLLSGTIHMAGLTWTSKQRVGKSPSSTSSFALGPVTIKLGGLIPVPVPSSDNVAAVLGAVNSVTGIFGLDVETPAASNGPAPDTTTVGPLDLRFSGTSLDNSVVSPANNPVTQIEQFLATNGSLAGNSSCNLAGSFYSVDTLVNVVLGALEGSGGVDVDLGGATAQTQAAGNYSNPFGGVPPVSPLPFVAPTSSGSPAASLAAAPPTGVDLGTPSPATTSLTTLPAPATPAVASSAICKTTSPAGAPGCWGGAGPVAAGAIVVLGAGLVAADLRRTGRLRRRTGLRRLDQ